MRRVLEERGIEWLPRRLRHEWSRIRDAPWGDDAIGFEFEGRAMPSTTTLIVRLRSCTMLRRFHVEAGPVSRLLRVGTYGFPITMTRAAPNSPRPSAIIKGMKRPR